MNQNNENEINLFDLLYQIAKGWRFIVIFMIAFSFIFAFAGIWQNTHMNFSEDDKTAELTLLAKTNTQITNLQKEIENNTSSIAKVKDYMKQSVLLNLKPESVSTVIMTCSLDLTEPTGLTPELVKMYTDNIMRNYAQASKSETFAPYVIQQTGFTISETMLLELIKLNKSDSDKNLMITVRYSSETDALAIAYATYNYITKNITHKLQNIHAHTIALSDLVQKTGQDDEIVSRKQTQEDRINTFQQKIDDNLAQLNTIAEQSLTAKEHKSIGMQIIIGLFLGAFLAVGWILADFFLHRVIRSSADIKLRIPDFHIFAVDPAYRMKAKSRRFGVVDSFIDRVWGYSDKTLPRDEMLAYTAATIRSLVLTEHQKENDAKTVLFTSTGSYELTENITRDLQSKLSLLGQEKLHYIPTDDVRRSSLAMTDLSKSDAVVLVEQSGKSKFQDVQELLGLMQMLSKEIIGIILLS